MVRGIRFVTPTREPNTHTMAQVDTPSTDFLLQLNEQAFTIPHALLSEAQRRHEAGIERDTKQLRAAFLGLSAQMQSDRSIEGKESALVHLDEVMRDVQALEKRLRETVTREGALLNRIRKRIEFYGEYEKAAQVGTAQSLKQWYLNYTNLLVADYLARNAKTMGLVDPESSTTPENSGVVFLKQQEMQDLLDYDILLGANKISCALVDEHDLGPLVEWIAENKKALEKERSPLEFYANFQTYVQELLCGDISEAITCLQTTLFKYMSTHFDEVTAACGMLVYAERCVLERRALEKSLDSDVQPQVLTDPTPAQLQQQRERAFEYFFHRRMPVGPSATSGPRTRSKTHTLAPKPDSAELLSNMKNLQRYQDLLSDSGWSRLNEMFLESYYSMYRIAKNEPLLIYISLGVSALKTRSCLHKSFEWDPRLDALCKDGKGKFGANKCPVCSTHFSRLAKTLPFAHHTESKLFDNPVMLPSGNIYDSNRLKMLAKVISDSDIVHLAPHEVLDPIEGEVYKWNEFVTMYPT